MTDNASAAASEWTPEQRHPRIGYPPTVSGLVEWHRRWQVSLADFEDCERVLDWQRGAETQQRQVNEWCRGGRFPLRV